MNVPSSHGAPRRRELLPVRVLWSKGVSGEDRVLTAPSVRRATVPPMTTCTIEQGGGVLLDFGVEVNGAIQIVTGLPKDQRPAKVRVRFGESVSEAMGTPNQDHAIHDHEVQVAWCGATEVGQTGFRFVRIDVLPGSTPLNVVCIAAVTLMDETPVVGSFRSSDERLNRIWDTGARTIHRCMLDIIVDGPKRDRLAWMGDTVIENRVVRAVYGLHPLMPKTLEFLRDTTPPEKDMNFLYTYSLWWIIAMQEWFAWSGSVGFLECQRQYLGTLVERITAPIVAAPKWSDRPGSFVDHPTSRQADSALAGTRAIEVLALRAAGVVFQALGDEKRRAACMQAIELLKAHQPTFATLNKAATALLLAAGLKADAKLLMDNPHRGISAFTGAFVLDARALRGDLAGCLGLIRTYWGGMLDLGATTFWEDFDIDWLQNAGRIDELPADGKVDVHAEKGDYCYKGHRHSLCHGWSASPTAWLSRNVLGFRPVPGDACHVFIQPNLAGLEFAEGTWPTPLGPVYVRHQARQAMQFDAPSGVRISV